jgi:hypothetical protein
LMFLVLNKRGLCRCKFLYHASHRWSADIEFLGKGVGACAFPIFSQLIDIFQVVLNRNREDLFHSLAIPERDRCTGKESQKSNIEARAFRPVAYELREDALNDQPRDRHRDRVDSSHPNWKSGFP